MAEWKNADATLQRELLVDVQKPSDQGYQELMRRCDDRIKQLEEGIQIQQKTIELYQKVVEGQDIGVELPGCDAMKQEDQHCLEDDHQYQLLQDHYQLLHQQLTLAQKELLQQRTVAQKELLQ